MLDRIDAWLKSGGQLALIGRQSPRDVDGRPWDQPAEKFGDDWLTSFPTRFPAIAGVDGPPDGVWTARRGHQTFRLNMAKEGPFHDRNCIRSVLRELPAPS